LTADISKAFRYRDLAKEGIGLPVAGGLLDQTESFMTAWQLIDFEEVFWERANKPD
jgi:hypothetical protein